MPGSKRANRYGSLAERWAADKYRLRREGEHTSWCDAVRESDGRPVEIKACKINRENPRFRVFREYHEELADRGGLYVFVCYKPKGRGITVLRSCILPAGDLPASTWYGAGGHRNSEQVKLPPSRVFG